MNAGTPGIQVTRHRGPIETRHGFSMTEVLVVIAVIAVLASLLLVALGGARRRALRTQTASTMQEFSKACDAFQLEHQRYPGLIPEEILAANPLISGTENALLELMGGGVRGDDPDYDFLDPAWREIQIADTNTPLGRLKVNLNVIGEGPRINGTPYAPYFTPGASQLAPTAGQVGGGLGGSPLQLPDLIDAWGQPIIYVRRVRTLAGPLVGDPDTTGPPPQFVMGGITPYIDSTRLGEFGQNQTPANNNRKYSILNAVSGNPNEINATFAQIIRHPAFGAPDEPLKGTARGAYFLDSAGPDGIFFSRVDGPGSPSEPVDDIVNRPGGPNLVKEYDDVRIFGGG